MKTLAKYFGIAVGP